MEVRKYRNSPVEEAVCDLQFAPKTEWDPTLPGLLYEKLKKTYNEKPRQVQFFEAPAHALKTEGLAGPPFVQGILKQRVQLLADNATRIVGIALINSVSTCCDRIPGGKNSAE